MDTKNKRCFIYEGHNDVQKLKRGTEDGLMTLEGCFGVCSKKNRNNRIYEKDNYAKMVDSINERIKKDGCIMGELEHPQGMNINLENVSHKITKLNIDEDGVITGTIQLLNTPKGRLAQDIVNGGCPLHVSSRACGTVDKDGHVQLENLVTYDLVGTPGFEEAQVNLKENQTFEHLTESLCIITEEAEEPVDEGCKKTKEGACEEDCTKGKKVKKENCEEEECEGKKVKKENCEEEECEGKKVKKENCKESEEENEDLKALLNEVNALKEQLKSAATKIELLENASTKTVDETKEWFLKEVTPLTEEWMKNYITDNVKTLDEDGMKEKLHEFGKTYSQAIDEWVMNEFCPTLTNYIDTEVRESIGEDYKTLIVEKIAPCIQKYLTEEFAPAIEGWITEEYSPTVDKYLKEEFADVIEGWLNEHLVKDIEESVLAKCQNQITESLKNTKDSKMKNITEMLTLLEGMDVKKPTYSAPINEDAQDAPLYIQKMPQEFRPLYEQANDDVKDYIKRKAMLFDFVGDESIKRFWESVDFNKEFTVKNPYESLNNVQDERERDIRARLIRNRNRSLWL